MKTRVILRSLIALLLMCGTAAGAMQYSNVLGARKEAELAAIAAEAAARKAECREKLSQIRQTVEEEMEKAEAAAEAAAAEAAAEQAAEAKFVPAEIYYPDTTPADIQQLFDDYRSSYPDVIGYIYSPYTPINYPILRGTSTDDFYLHHDITGNEDANGCIFLEHLNNQSFMDDNSILYGHHMSNGSMFASISYYKSSSYYYAHPYMYLLTPGQNYRLDLWAGIVCPHDDPVFATGHDAANRQSFYDRSTFRTALGAPEGRMVTLCTCSYEADNYRYCVLGNLVPIS